MATNILSLTEALKTKQVKDVTFERLGLTLIFEDNSQLIVRVKADHLHATQVGNIDLNLKLIDKVIEKNL